MTAVLLDTHVVLWWLAADPRLTSPMREAVQRSDAAYVSAASSWEVALKMALGKLTIELPAGRTFAETCSDQGFALVAVTHEDAWSVRTLPPARTDPFDRLLAATARRRGWTIATADPAFESLDVDLLRP